MSSARYYKDSSKKKNQTYFVSNVFLDESVCAHIEGGEAVIPTGKTKQFFFKYQNNIKARMVNVRTHVLDCRCF